MYDRKFGEGSEGDQVVCPQQEWLLALITAPCSGNGSCIDNGSLHREWILPCRHREWLPAWTMAPALGMALDQHLMDPWADQQRPASLGTAHEQNSSILRESTPRINRNQPPSPQYVPCTQSIKQTQCR